MTKRLGDIRLPYRHFERKREIFVIRGQADNVWKFKTGNLLAGRPSGIATILYSAALPYFYAPYYHFAFRISNFSFNRGFRTRSRDEPPNGPTPNPFHKENIHDP